MGRDIEDAGTWIRGGVLFFSLIGGALLSTWLNSMDARSANANSPNAAATSTVVFTVPAEGVTVEAIGVGLDQRRLEYIRTAN